MSCENRRLYRDKFEHGAATASRTRSRCRCREAAFYLWLPTPIPDTEFARAACTIEYNVTVLPGSYLAREAHGVNPGANFVRIALVPPLDECLEAAGG